MSARITIERLLRDDDDASGQTIRQWKIEADPGMITLRHNHGDGFIMLRSADVHMLIHDLTRAQTAADQLAEED